jgi:hypothetical protein
MPLTQDQIRDRLNALLADMAAPVVPTVSVKSGDNLASLLASQTIDNTVYLLPAGVTFAGPFPFTKPCTIQTAGPAPASRVQPTDPLAILLDAFVKPTAPVTLANLALVPIGVGTIFPVGDGTTLDRVFTRGGPAGQHRGIQGNARNVIVRRCWVDNIVSSDQDAQAFACWDGAADILLDDNYLESSGENFICGGADASSQANIPTRITMQNCDLSKRLAWRGTNAIVKNLVEAKNIIGLTVRNNRGSYCWLSGQTGYAILLTVRNQDGTNPYAIVSGVLFEDNQWSHLGAGIQFLGQDDAHPSQRMTDVTIRRDRFIDVNPGIWGGDGRQIYFAGGPKGVTLEDLQFDGAHLNSAFSFDGAAQTCDGLVVTRGRYQEGDYGIKGPGTSSGKPSLDKWAPNTVWTGVTMQVGNPLRSDGPPKGSIPYPPTTTVIP